MLNLYLPHCHIYGRKGLEIYIIVNDLLGCLHLTGSAWSSPSTPPSARNPQDYLADKSLVGLTNEELKKALKKPFYTLSDIFIVVKFQDKTYHFLIPKGYDWNGANVLPFAWLLIGQQKEPRFKLPSCVHDYLCEHKEVIDNNRYLSTLK